MARGRCAAKTAPALRLTLYVPYMFKSLCQYSIYTTPQPCGAWSRVCMPSVGVAAFWGCSFS